MILAVAALVIITAIAGTVVQVPFALRLVCALPGEVSSGGVEQLQVCLPRLCMDWRPVFGGIGRPSSGPSRPGWVSGGGGAQARKCLEHAFSFVLLTPFTLVSGR